LFQALPVGHDVTTVTVVDNPAPQPARGPVGLFTVERYFALVDEGLLQPDDRVELLEGVVVAMAPQNSPHASGVSRVTHVLIQALTNRAVVRTQMSFIAGQYSVPEPDVAVVPGRYEDYDQSHPRAALLVVEIADSSLKQDRLTKAMIYTAAAVPEYWIVNVRGQQVEVHRDPDPAARRYRSVTILRRDETIDLVAFPDTTVAVDDLLPVLAR
jgi:Uma2 family endonuclease